MQSIPALKDNRLALSRFKSAYEAGASAIKQARDVASKIDADKDLDEPLGEVQMSQLMADWKKSYDLDMDPQREPADTLRGRVYREFKRKSMTVLEMRKVKTVVSACVPSTTEVAVLSDSLALQLKREQVSPIKDVVLKHAVNPTLTGAHLPWLNLRVMVPRCPSDARIRSPSPRRKSPGHRFARLAWLSGARGCASRGMMRGAVLAIVAIFTFAMFVSSQVQPAARSISGRSTSLIDGRRAPHRLLGSLLVLWFWRLLLRPLPMPRCPLGVLVLPVRRTPMRWRGLVFGDKIFRSRLASKCFAVVLTSLQRTADVPC